MPTYVYKFTDTGETIEVLQAFTDDALTEAVHPASGATMSVKKVFTPVGVTFKGGGFYKTDSRGSSPKSSSSNAPSPAGANSSDSGGSSSSGSSSGSSSESSGSSSTPAPAATPAAAPASSSGSSTS